MHYGKSHGIRRDVIPLPSLPLTSCVTLVSLTLLGFSFPPPEARSGDELHAHFRTERIVMPVSRALYKEHCRKHKGKASEKIGSVDELCFQAGLWGRCRAPRVLCGCPCALLSGPAHLCGVLGFGTSSAMLDACTSMLTCLSIPSLHHRQPRQESAPRHQACISLPACIHSAFSNPSTDPYNF